MSKSITGSGSLNLTLNELRLLEIKATAIEATNATITNQLNGNNAIFSGTVSAESLTLENLTIDDMTSTGTITATNITASASGTITANGNVVINSLPLDNTDNNDRYITFQGVGNVLHGDSNLVFNPNTNTLSIIILTCQDITANGTISSTLVTTTNLKIVQLLTNSNDNFYACMFQGNNNDISQAPLLANFHYNPFQLKLKLDNLDVTNDTDITGDLTVDGSASLSSNISCTSLSVSVQALQATTTGNNYAIIGYDYANVGRTLNVDTANFYYNKTTETLHAPNFSGSVSVVAQTRSGSSTAYPVSFHDTTTNEVCVDSAPTQLSYNPGTNILSARNIAIAVKTTTASLYMTSLNNTTSAGCQIPLRLTTNGQVKQSANFTYDADDDTLNGVNGNFSGNLNADRIILDTGSIFNHSTNVYMGLRGQFTTGIDYNLALWSDGSVRYVAQANGGHRFDVRDSGNTVTDQILNINFTTVDVYKNLNIRGTAKIETDNDLVFLEENTSVTGTKGVVSFSNIGQIIANRGSEVVLRLVNRVAQLAGTIHQIELGENVTKINTPNAGGTGAIKLELDGDDKVVVDDAKTTIKNVLAMESVTVPSTSANYPVLLLDEGTDEVKKTNNALRYNPVTETLQAKHITIGSLPINYVCTYSSRCNSTGDAYICGGVNHSWGQDSSIFWPTQASDGGSPTVSQYGADISDGSLKSAIHFQNGSIFRLLSNDYGAGWWWVEISLLWQNLDSTRMMPRIDLGKRTVPATTLTEQPQVSQASEYIRNDSGEISNLAISGPIYMASTSDMFGIMTKVEDAAGGIAVPPNWNETVDASKFKGLGLNISCKFLGGANTAGETVNTL